MDILKENQNIADTRTEDAIQKEALEMQVTELEHKAEIAKHEVEVNILKAAASETLPSNKDEEMKDESAIIAKTVVHKSKSAQSAAAGESAGKKSTTGQGGLAKMLFGQGEEQKPAAAEKEGSESEEIMRMVEEGSDDSIEENKESQQKEEVIKVEEIQLELVNPENVAAKIESEEEKYDFIKKSFINPLLSRVFKFID